LRIPQGNPVRAGLKQQALSYWAAFLNACFGPREKQAFGILMYHRIAVEPAGRPKPTWNVRPRRLEQQLAGLLARGWQAWPLRQVLSCAARDLPIPRKTFVVTFDDGYANNLIHAAPILTRLHVPATVFVATAYLDSKQPFPSDDWPPAGQPGVPSETWRPLTTEECRRLSANGLIELGAHTHTHSDFRGRRDALADDLRQNLTVLHESFGVEQPAFAFPYGTKIDGFASSDLAQAAREVGVTCSLTSEADIVRTGDSPFDWGRFAVEDHDTAGTLAGKLGGWQTALRRLRHAALPRTRGSV
jgi:peptidoglycan/xylan/chitin deacetylase (PgdA/CDA1 family)